NDIEEPPDVDKATRNYAEHDRADLPIAVTEENLRIIGKVLTELQDDESSRSWEAIVNGGLAGYEQYIHHLIRIGWCFEQVLPFNPCISEEDILAYPIANPLSLIAEHKFLQLVAIGRLWQKLAIRSHTEFTIMELVLANPLTDEATVDYET